MPARSRPPLELPEDAAERAEALRALAADLVATYGATTALALAAAIDEAVAEADQSMELMRPPPSPANAGPDG